MIKCAFPEGRETPERVHDTTEQSAVAGEKYIEAALRADLDNDFDRSVELAKKAIRANPLEYSYHLTLSFFYYKNGAYRLALEEVLTAERLANPEVLKNKPGIYLSISDCYAALGEYDKSIEYTHRIEASNSDDFSLNSARKKRAEVYEKAGKLDLAIKEYKLLSTSKDEYFQRLGLEGIERLKGSKGK
jgi:tetratricopeptide (TPR) repeat protein